MLETHHASTRGGGPDLSGTIEYTYIVSGPKFRSTCKLVSAADTNAIKLLEDAFNGTSFVSYNADARRMTRQAKIPPIASGELVVSPLIVPFLFLSKNSDDCPGCLLRFVDIVSPDFAKGLILPKGQPSNGLLHISMPGLPLAKKPTSWKIDMDEAGDSFTPKAVTYIIEAGGVLTFTLLNYTNLGGYQFPTAIKCVQTTYPPTTLPTVITESITTVTYARIPDKVADSVFNLDDEEKSAATVWDSDQNKSVKSPYDQEKADLRKQPHIYDESADGAKQIADALVQARKEHKQVLLQFGANWCLPCHHLHKLFETDKTIAQELRNHYVVVMIDVNKGHNKDIVTKYDPIRSGIPAIAVLDSEGKRLTVQDTGTPQDDDNHSPEKILTFLKEWSPKS
jgi:thiol-disulfide isomerase/thioredoxin